MKETFLSEDLLRKPTDVYHSDMDESDSRKMQLSREIVPCFLLL